ncbi:unnamed protein product [Orchesella dallaii]|uniref:Uncharacterized protein n=1 Tax=Orchesella dallaii TaxID=48710 RepID=A0ABP1RLV7_9HEXA
MMYCKGSCKLVGYDIYRYVCPTPFLRDAVGLRYGRFLTVDLTAFQWVVQSIPDIRNEYSSPVGCSHPWKISDYLQRRLISC